LAQVIEDYTNNNGEKEKSQLLSGRPKANVVEGKKFISRMGEIVIHNRTKTRLKNWEATNHAGKTRGRKVGVSLELRGIGGTKADEAYSERVVHQKREKSETRKLKARKKHDREKNKSRANTFSGTAGKTYNQREREIGTRLEGQKKGGNGKKLSHVEHR